MTLPTDINTYYGPIMGSMPLEIYSGRVMDEKMWSESHVSGGGGGGLTVAGYGASSTRRVKTRVVNKREIWLKLDDGSELAVEVDADRVKVRKGQYITAITMSKGRRRGEKMPILVYNHASNETCEAVKPGILSMSTTFGGIYTAVYMFYCFFALFALLMGGSIFYGLVIPAIGGSYYFFGWKKAKALYDRLEQHMRSLPRRSDVEAAA